MKPLNIAILGYNSQLSIKGFRQFIENNMEQVKNVSHSRHVARLTDGTTIETITNIDDWHLRGRRIDQLMLFDDDRWEILDKRYWDIKEIEKYTMQTSIIPEEFQILKYEDIR